MILLLLHIGRPALWVFGSEWKRIARNPRMLGGGCLSVTGSVTGAASYVQEGVDEVSSITISYSFSSCIFCKTPTFLSLAPSSSVCSAFHRSLYLFHHSPVSTLSSQVSPVSSLSLQASPVSTISPVTPLFFLPPLPTVYSFFRKRSWLLGSLSLSKTPLVLLTLPFWLLLF